MARNRGRSRTPGHISQSIYHRTNQISYVGLNEKKVGHDDVRLLLSISFKLRIGQRDA